MSATFKVHGSYPPVPAFEWPKPGQRTWQPPAESFFGTCSGTSSCTSGPACPVGVVVTLDAPVYGCDCPCHDVAREQAAKRRAEPRPAVPWWNEIRNSREWRRCG